jgi:hypothetical protein
MTKYRIIASLLTGLGFVSLICLLMNIRILTFFLSLLFFPGGIFLVIVKLDSYKALLVANVVVYSLLALCVILAKFRGLPDEHFKWLSVRMILPVAVVSTLACFPALNLLLPVGMAELARQELEMQQALNPGVNLQEARSILSERKIEFSEYSEKSGDPVFLGADKRIDASAGDTVVSGHGRTSAWSFPCSYEMRIILLFGADGKLKDSYIRRFPLCP